VDRPTARASNRREVDTRRFSVAYERIYATVARIPRGRVATYGQIAALAGLARRARQVGYALHALDESRSVPWHRVVNAEGRISLRGDPIFKKIQRRLLAHEGVRFDAGGRIDLELFRWRPCATRTT
jgi:methylated-DNA-protein-cysteine methyltransferase related protein